MASLPADPRSLSTLRRPAARLPGLDALRGIAALAVLGYHASGHFGGGPPTLFTKGYLAVDFFFMLSGYVMARTYETRMAQGLGAWRFLWARYKRLWPVMAAGAALGAPLLAEELGAIPMLPGIALANLLLLPVFVGGLIFPVNAAAWSILFELGANWLHGALLWRLRTVALVGLTALSLAMMIAACLHFGSFDIGARPANVLGGVPRAILSYVAGVVLWRWWRDRPPFLLPAALTFLAMPAFLLLTDFADSTSPVVDFAFVLLLCPLLVAGGLCYEGDHPLARWTGLLSFPLYAVHMPMLHWAKELGWDATTGLAAALLVAGAMTLWINRPPALRLATA